MDTRQKRFSMMNFASGRAVSQATLFEADGTVDKDDRQHLLDCYSGVAFQTPTPAVEVPWILQRAPGIP